MRKLRSIVPVLVLVLGAPRALPAAGFQSLEQGTSDIGRAMVGSASLADSATTAWWNPAGMTRLDRPELVSGAMFIDGDGKFQSNASTTVPGDDGGNSLSNAFAPGGLFYVHPIGEELAVGFTATAPIVGSLDYGATWAGRYIVRSFDLTTIAAGPAVAYEVTDRLSVGLQGLVVYGDVDLKVALNTGGLPAPMPVGDGRVKIDGADQWTFAWGAGLHWEPIDGTRIGLAYKSEIDLDDLEGDFELNVGPGFMTTGVEVGFTLPQAVNLSAMHRLTDELTLFADAGWADFSEFDLIGIDLSIGAVTQLRTSFRDTYAYGFAAAYELSPIWTLQAGWSYASSPVRSSNRNPVLPFDRQIRYGTGVIYKWREDVDLALSYEYLDLGDSRFSFTMANGDVVAGDYDPNRVQFVALTLTKRF